MKNTFCLALLSLFITTNAQNLTRQEYIDKYAPIALREMQSHGIPASITMAQGILESNNGNSYLAVEANNHFGIKCHDWLGPSVTKDDDKRNECFRKYEHPLASFEDHSLFLVNRKRYAFLFDYDVDDYKAWAKGLKKAGYATNPQYPQLLIRIIEEHELYKLDQQVEAGLVAFEDEKVEIVDTAKAIDESVNTGTADVTHNYQQLTADVYKTANGVAFIVLTEDISLEQIAERFNLHVWELYRYNDVHRSQDFNLHKGQRVFVEAKRHRAPRGTPMHKVQMGEKMIDIAQLYGVKLKALYRMNGMSIGTQAKPGTPIIVARP